MSGDLILEDEVRANKAMGVTKQFVTMRINGQLFAIAAILVEDVLLPQKITPIPLASVEILGLLNLRGRVVTAIDLRVKMGMEPSEKRLENKSVVVIYHDNLYSFVIDDVTGVYDIPVKEIEHNPDNLSEEWKEYCSGIYKLKNELMVILNIEGLLHQDKGSE